MKNLSILIPTYNDACAKLVDTLRQQAEALDISYEIIVADDGSTNAEVVRSNRQINQWAHCRMDERPQNSGRASVRNYLAQQAQYNWLLFIDSDMVVCNPDFLKRYVNTTAEVVDGGVVIGPVVKGNLRALYEKANEQQHTVDRRCQTPYQHFHTANFLVRRDIMLAHPFDLRFRRYGYEDVLFGKALQQHLIPIEHIDNPLSFEIYEGNEAFVCKTEEGLRTLYEFRNELQSHSRLLTIVSGLSPWIICAVRLFHRLFGRLERRHLTGSHPTLSVFSLYRLGYYLQLSAKGV